MVHESSPNKASLKYAISMMMADKCDVSYLCSDNLFKFGDASWRAGLAPRDIILFDTIDAALAVLAEKVITYARFGKHLGIRNIIKGAWVISYRDTKKVPERDIDDYTYVAKYGFCFELQPYPTYFVSYDNLMDYLKGLIIPKNVTVSVAYHDICRPEE